MLFFLHVQEALGGNECPTKRHPTFFGSARPAFSLDQCTRHQVSNHCSEAIVLRRSLKKDSNLGTRGAAAN